MHTIRSLAVVLSFALASVALAEAPPQPAPAAAPVKKCEHGVSKPLCSRCNPKLEPVFKAKNDWCAEHARPESQCVICNPALAKQGIK